MALVVSLGSLPLPQLARVVRAADNATYTETYGIDGTEGRTISHTLPNLSGYTIQNRTVTSTGASGLIQYDETDLSKFISDAGVMSYKVGSGSVGSNQTLSITLTLEDSNQTVTTYTVQLKVTLEQLTPNASVTTSSSYTYGVTVNDIGYSAKFTDPLTGATVPGSFSWDDKGTSAIKVENSGLAYTFTPSNTSKYKTVKGTASVNIKKATPIVAAPTVADLTYDASKPLGKITLKSSNGSWTEAGKTVSVSGKWEFVNPTQVPSVNISNYSCVFKPLDSANYNEVYCSVSIKVTKATPKITTKPTITPITLGDSLEMAQFSGGVANCSGTFYWENKSLKPTIADSGKTKFEYYFLPYDTTNYEIYRDSVTVTVNKITEAPNTPRDMSVGYGCKTVSDVVLPENWIWNAADAKKEIKGKGDSVVATAEYVGEDKDNYQNIKKSIVLTKSSCYHNAIVYRYSKSATCTQCGYQGDKYCKICNAYMGNGELIEPLGHNYVSTITTKPTTTSYGVRTYKCSRCKHTYTEKILSLSENSNGVLTLKPVLDENVNAACVTLSLADVETAVEASADHSITVNVLPISGSSSVSAKRTEVTLPLDVQEKLVQGSMEKLVIKTADMKLALDQNAIKALLQQSEGAVTISILNATGENPRPVFAVSAIKADESQITEFGTGVLTLTIPYIRQRVNEKGEVSSTGTYEEIEKIKGVYTDDSGKSTFLQNSSYDEAAAALIIPTDHLSTYGVGYQTKSLTDRSGVIIRLKSTVGKTTVKLSWNAVEDADSYVIYGGKVGSGYKKLATVTTTSYTVSKLKKGTAYRYYVKACKTEDGATTTISTSYKIYTVTNGGKYGNQGTFTVKPKNVTISAGNIKKLKVSYKKTGTLKKFISYVRYQSSDTQVATVSSSGSIVAGKKGTCYIYIYGQNGYKTCVKVTVL